MIICNKVTGITSTPHHLTDTFSVIFTNKVALILVKFRNSRCKIVGRTVIISRIASLLPRYEDNKSLKKCYGNVDKDFAADILRRLFSCR